MGFFSVKAVIKSPNGFGGLGGRSAAARAPADGARCRAPLAAAVRGGAEAGPWARTCKADWIISCICTSSCGLSFSSCCGVIMPYFWGINCVNSCGVIAPVSGGRCVAVEGPAPAMRAPAGIGVGNEEPVGNPWLATHALPPPVTAALGGASGLALSAGVSAAPSSSKAAKAAMRSCGIACLLGGSERSAHCL